MVIITLCTALVSQHCRQPFKTMDPCNEHVTLCKLSFHRHPLVIWLAGCISVVMGAPEHALYSVVLTSSGTFASLLSGRALCN